MPRNIPKQRLTLGSEAPHAAALNVVTRYLLQEQNATALLEQSCQVLQQIDSPRMLALVQTIAAQWDLAQGEWEQAIARTEVALKAAQQVNNPSETALAWTILIQARYQGGNLKKAQQQFVNLKCAFWASVESNADSTFLDRLNAAGMISGRF